MATARVCELENASQARLVCSILDEQKIPYNLIESHDSAFDGLYESQTAWGIIEAPEEYVTVIQGVVADVRQGRQGAALDGRVAPHGKPRRKFLWLEIGIGTVLVLYSIAVTLSALGLADRLRHFERRSPLVAWKWIRNEKCMRGTMRATGKLRYLEYDRNDNGIYEERDIISKNGKYKQTDYDRHEDGYDDEIVLKDMSGTVVFDEFDTQGLGSFDLWYDYYAPDYFLEYRVTTGGRIPDLVIVHTHGTTRVLDIRKDLLGLSSITNR